MLRDVMAIASKGPSPTGAPAPKKAKSTKAVKGSAGMHPTYALPTCFVIVKVLPFSMGEISACRSGVVGRAECIGSLGAKGCMWTDSHGIRPSAEGLWTRNKCVM